MRRWRAIAMEHGCHVLTEKARWPLRWRTRAVCWTPRPPQAERWASFSRTAITRVPSIRRCLTTEFGRGAARACLLTWDRSPEYYSQSDWKGTWDKEGGGVIIDQAIHTLDLMRWFIGRPVTGVQASLANRTHPDIPVEDTAEGRVEFERRCVRRLLCDESLLHRRAGSSGAGVHPGQSRYGRDPRRG